MLTISDHKKFNKQVPDEVGILSRLLSEGKIRAESESELRIDLALQKISNFNDFRSKKKNQKIGS